MLCKMSDNININTENYELYVIDYLEGKLPHDKVLVFERFLDNNPIIKDEIEGLMDFNLNKPSVKFPDKEKLKASPIITYANINEDNYQSYFIAFHENELSEKEKHNTLEFLKKNSQLRKSFELFGKLNLIPDNNIVFTDKDSLKKRKTIAPLWYSSAAAVVVLLFSIGWFLQKESDSIIIPKHFQISTLEQKIPESIANKYQSKPTYHFEKKQITKITFAYLPNEEYQIEQPNDRRNLSISSLNTVLCNNIAESNYGMLDFSNTNQNNIPVSNDAIAMSPEEKKPSLLGSIFNNQVKAIGNIFSINRDKDKNKEEKSIEPTFVRIVDNSLLVFNTITGSETDTEKKYNNKGELTSYKVSGHEIMISRKYPASSTN